MYLYNVCTDVFMLIYVFVYYVLNSYCRSGRMSNASKPDEKNESDLTQRELKQKYVCMHICTYICTTVM